MEGIPLHLTMRQRILSETGGALKTKETASAGTVVRTCPASGNGDERPACRRKFRPF